MRDEELTLEEYVAERLRKCGRCSKYEVLREVYRGYRQGKISLRDPNPPHTFIEYVSRLDYSLWFWTALALAAATLVTVVASDLLVFIQYVRYVLGTLYVLFLPGYLTIEALYPEPRELKPLERLALSIGLSLAIVPLMGLALNYTPAGITLTSTLLAISAYMVAIALVAAWRKYKLVERTYKGI